MKKSLLCASLLLVSMNFASCVNKETILEKTSVPLQVSNEKILSHTLKSQTIEGYFAIKRSLMEKVLDQIDFSNINLEKSYSIIDRMNSPYSQIKIVEGKRVFECELTSESDTHVIFKNGKTIIVSSFFNAKMLRNVSCDDSVLEDYIKVETFRIPSKSEFKKAFFDSIFGSEKRSLTKKSEGTDMGLDNVLFEVDETGFKMTFDDGVVSSFHPGKAKNANHIFLEDEETTDYQYQELNLAGLDLTKKIDLVINAKVPFVGWNSLRMAYGNDELIEYVNTEKTIGEYLSENALL